MPLFERLARTRRSATKDHPGAPVTGASVEVIVLWGDALQLPEQHADVLHVAQLGDDDGFAVGDAMRPGNTVLEGTQLATDYLIDSAQLGVERLPIVVRGAYGQDGKRMPLVVVPQGACVRAFGDDGRVRDAAQLIVDNELCSSGDHAFPYAWPVATGTTLWLAYRGFTFVVRMAAPIEPVAAKGITDWNGQRYAAVSLAAHLFLLALFYYSPPKTSAMTNDGAVMDQRYLDYVLKSDEFIEPDLPELQDEGTPGEAAAQGEQGTYGEPDAKQKVSKTTKRTGGGPNAPTPEDLKTLATTGGILGVLKSSAPIADGLFTGAAAGGKDSYAALAALMGTMEGPSWGSNGLGPSGFGRGGGGFALGTIGSGPLGTIGDPGAGAGRGTYGTAVGNLVKRDGRVPPRIKGGKPDIIGSLSKETIRRVIHRRLNEVRFCYEQGLQSRPDLQGRVAVRFIIGPTGIVQAAAVASSDVADVKVQRCITDVVGRMTFPVPEGRGIVSVTYPFVLEQVGG